MITDTGAHKIKYQIQLIKMNRTQVYKYLKV